MRLAFFVHSAVSDWNHGNAHFVRGLMDALARRGHRVTSWEPRGAWSLENLLRESGPEAVVRFARAYPRLDVRSYPCDATDLHARLEEAVEGADVVVAHEWIEPQVLRTLVDIRDARDDFELFFHDTHHRAVSAPELMGALPLDRVSGVLAFGRSLARVHRRAFGARRAWVLHEAADVLRFRPLEREKDHDVSWIGNWGDDERGRELRTFWLGAARALQDLRFVAHGARYPDDALAEASEAGVAFRGWASSLDVPEIMARGRVTLHIPRRPYPEALPGIPTIRVFEALACGIPLVSTPWRDSEGLFEPGDYAVVRSPPEMIEAIRCLTSNSDAAIRQTERGLATVLARHTCDHRADELLDIVEELGREGSDTRPHQEAACD